MTELPPVYWRACSCHVWPLTALYGTGTCGACGEYPEFEMPEQEKARPLTEEEKRGQAR